jgi:glycogen phosphorylase
VSERHLSVQISGLNLAEIELPKAVDGFYDLAYNLWWTWNPAARHLFSTIDAATWSRYHNPIELLLHVDRSHWESLVDNDPFMSAYEEVLRAFGRYLEEPATWFHTTYPSYEGGPVAYLSTEFGIHPSLSIYSGGLGVLSGDHCKAASDLGIPFVAVGLLYRRGYFRQTIDADGFQQHTYPEYDFHRLPIRPALDHRGREVTVRVPFPGREVIAKVWLAQVGRVPLLLLDTDVPDNDPSDRPITGVLYVRGREMRLSQELVLGAGGVQALAALSIEPAVWHVNEGHSALFQLERLRAAQREDLGFEEALAAVRRNTSFTTHTPVPAGNEEFERSLALRYLEPWGRLLAVDPERLLELGHADHGEPGQALNLTAFALRTSSFTNGVSRIHAEVSDRMWRHLFPEKPADEPVVEAITNGVHVPSWLGLEVRSLLEKVLGEEWQRALLEEDGWAAVAEIPDEELWSAHQAQKRRLLRFTRVRLRRQYARHGSSPSELRGLEELLDPEILTIGFARRFATYKRAGLLFSDPHRMRSLLCHRERPVQVFLAGKAHPADRPGQELVRHLYQLSQEPDLRGRVVFLENYNIRVARHLVQGVDLWLNTPRRPLEASGTSGQKAAANGVLNLSVLDGWWPEAYDGTNGWSFGTEDESVDEWKRDSDDALSLYHVLEHEVVPTFYERGADGLPTAWIRRMKRAMATVGPRFSASRMLRDYLELAYLPLTRQAGAPAEEAGESVAAATEPDGS